MGLQGRGLRAGEARRCVGCIIYCMIRDFIELTDWLDCCIAHRHDPELVILSEISFPSLRIIYVAVKFWDDSVKDIISDYLFIPSITNKLYPESN